MFVYRVDENFHHLQGVGLKIFSATYLNFTNFCSIFHRVFWHKELIFEVSEGRIPVIYIQNFYFHQGCVNCNAICDYNMEAIIRLGLKVQFLD